MKKKTLSLFIVASFLALILLIWFMFTSMNQKIKNLNEDTVKNVGFTYLSSLNTETINHSKTYFSSKLETLNQVLNAVTNSDMDEESSKQYILDEIAGGALYIALLTKDGEREVLRGDHASSGYGEI